MNIAIFNFGNATGAALGGVVIHQGLGLPSVALAGAATALAGLGLVLMFQKYKKGEGEALVEVG